MVQAGSTLGIGSMEATESVEHSRIVMDEVIPPRLEDAGLEDCALPLESIHEAFLKAAAAVGSAFPSDEDEDDDDGRGSGSDAPEGSTGGDPPQSTPDASDVVAVIERECAAEDCGSSRAGATKKAEEDGASSSAEALQKLEIR